MLVVQIVKQSRSRRRRRYYRSSGTNPDYSVIIPFSELWLSTSYELLGIISIGCESCESNENKQKSGRKAMMG